MPPAAAGLGRRRKLLHKDQFRQVFRCKTSVYAPFFGVHAAPNAGPFSRLGLTVSKRRVSKKAVQRNRIKRQIRESFRLNQSVLATTPPGTMDVVVIADGRAAQASGAALRAELDRLWRRLVRKAARRC